MAQVIQRGRELIRINTQKNTIQSSTDGGCNWRGRYMGPYPGTFYDLLDYGDEILACTSKGVYVSKDEGLNWKMRYIGSYCGTFRQLASEGTIVLATTSKGLFFSRDGGRNWRRR